jgi:hypothetical protein
MVARGRHPRAALLWGVLFALAGPWFTSCCRTSRRRAWHWCARYGITDANWIWMIPYFGILHPFSRKPTGGSAQPHPDRTSVFSRLYHVLVLLTLFSYPWLAATIPDAERSFDVLASCDAPVPRFVRPDCDALLADLGIVCRLAASYHSR